MLKYSRQPLAFCFLVCSLLLCAGASADEAKNRDLTLYHFGLPPYQKDQSAEQMRKLYQPMLDWLGQQAGCRFDFIGSETYEEMIDIVASGKVHLASLGPVPFIIAKQKNTDLRLLATATQKSADGKQMLPSYHGYILALKKRNDINSLNDLKDKTFAFVSRSSTSGFQYPNTLMLKMGINPEKHFGKIYFLGSHPRVTDAIAAGSVDAGATWDFNWKQARKKHGDIFKPIFKTPPIPNEAIVAHPSLPNSITEKILKALLKIDPSLLEGLPSKGFVVLSENHYDPILSIVNKQSKSGSGPE